MAELTREELQAQMVEMQDQQTDQLSGSEQSTWTTAEVEVTIVASIGPSILPEDVGSVDQAIAGSETWFVAWDETTVDALRIGEERTFTLRFSRAHGSRVQVPFVTQALVVILDVPPGVQLQSNRRAVVPASEGKVLLNQLDFKVIALLPGDYKLTARVYPGRVVEGAFVSADAALSVTKPAPLEKIPEVLDRRVIPAPRPDLQIYVALEPRSDGGEQVRMYVACPALDIDPTRRGKCAALPLTRADAASLRQAAAHQAAVSRRTPGGDDELALRRFGMALYDLLMPQLQPGELGLREIFRDFVLLEPLAERPLTILMIADDPASLPWELVRPYALVEEEDGTQVIEEEDFLAARFALSHWYGRQQLHMFNETPLRRMQLAHYGQHVDELPRWRQALGGDQRVELLPTTGELLVADPNSDVVGLHLLRYTDRRSAGLIASAEALARDPKQLAAEEHRLGFASRHPLVTLSFVAGQGSDDSQVQHTHFEDQWVLPLLKAEASALIGARWPTTSEIDQFFYRFFYGAVRQGRRLGDATLAARQAARAAYPGSADWLAYTYFGHPACEPYLVVPAQAYAVFEVVNQQVDAPLLHGQTYQFRASYGAFAPDNYQGRVHLEQPLPPLSDPKVAIDARFLEDPDFHSLRPVGDHVHEAIFSLRMPNTGQTVPVTAHFLDNERILQTVILNLRIE